MPRRKLGEYHRRKECKFRMSDWERGRAHKIGEYLGEKHFSPVVRKAVEFFYEYHKADIENGVRLGYSPS
tara:strand:- start:159 stop:368 length:210 start_codon:yes stop_codon:yes gene_type:complete